MSGSLKFLQHAPMERVSDIYKTGSRTKGGNVRVGGNKGEDKDCWGDFSGRSCVQRQERAWDTVSLFSCASAT